MDTRDGLSIDKWNPTTMRVQTSIASDLSDRITPHNGPIPRYY
jgi:hypothetical protein